MYGSGGIALEDKATIQVTMKMALAFLILLVSIGVIVLIVVTGKAISFEGIAKIKDLAGNLLGGM